MPGVKIGGQDGVVLRGRDAGIVERDVHPAVLGHHRLVQPPDVALAGHVGRDEFASGLFGGRLAGRLVDVDRYHQSPLGGEPTGTGQTDPAARPGDYRDPVLQPLLHQDLTPAWI